MWESARTVAPTPNSAIVQIDVDDNFVINSTHLNVIQKNKFDGYLRADPQDHIREFLAICNMFRCKAQSEAVKLMIFPLSLSDEAKTWFNELNEESITSWEQIKRAFINRFFPLLLFNRLFLEIRNFSQLIWKVYRSLVTTQEHASKMPWTRSDQRSYYSNILSRSRRTHSKNPGCNSRRNLPLQKSCKFKIIQKESIQIESHKYSTEHSSVNEFIVINIPEEDVEPKQIILDPDDQPMWESARTVAPTPNSAIVQIDVDDNFVINSTHLNVIQKNKFDGYLRADPQDHIREFLAICNMFRCKAQSEAVKLMIFPLSLSDEAKTWFNELNEESITSWEQIKRAFINRFFPLLLFNRLFLEIRNFSQLIWKVYRSLVTTQEHASKMPWTRSDQRSYYSNILSRSRRTHSKNPGCNSRRNLPLQKSKSSFSIS
nr:reverse transcriptase domain-containing protein [Tanacetum cinerariifolium]